MICVVQVYSWWFVDVGNVISAHTNDIAARRRRLTRSISDVAANICRKFMFGMECVADDVETWDCEAVGLLVIDVCLRKTNDINVIDLCQWLYDVTFCCWQPLDVELHDTQSRTYGLKAQVGVIGGVLPGFVTGIHKDSVRRWNLWFPSAGVFVEVLAGRMTGTQITFPQAQCQVVAVPAARCSRSGGRQRGNSGCQNGYGSSGYCCIALHQSAD